MEEAGSIESADMIDAMTKISVSGLTGDPITFDASDIQFHNTLSSYNIFS